MSSSSALVLSLISNWVMVVFANSSQSSSILNSMVLSFMGRGGGVSVSMVGVLQGVVVVVVLFTFITLSMRGVEVVKISLLPVLVFLTFILLPGVI